MIGVASATAFAGFGLKVAGDLQATEKGFVTLLGSAEEAANVMKRIKQEAKRTPFEIAGLSKATQLLTAVTRDGDKSIDILMDVGESLAAMGKGQEELDRIIVNLQQIGAVGKASMLDIKQFAFAGIPIFEMLEKTTGKTGEALQDMISDGEVSFDMLTTMFKEATDEGGQFFGAFQNQAGTFNQSLSNMKDSAMIFASEFVKQTGLFDAVTKGLTFFSSALSDNQDKIYSLVAILKDLAGEGIETAKAFYNYLEPNLTALLNSIKKLIPAFKDLVQAYVMPLITIFKNIFPTAVALTVDTLNLLVTVLRPLVGFFERNRTAVMALTAAVVTFTAGMRIKAAIDTAVIALTTLRMGFVASTISTLGMSGALSALIVAIKTAVIASGPLGWAIGAITIAAGLLTGAWFRNVAEADRLKAAQDRLKAATDALKESKDRLKEAELGVEGASLRLERAQLTLKQAVEQYGASSLEAREASLDLKRAELELKDAHNAAKDAVNAHNEAEKEYARNGGLIESANGKIRALQTLANLMQQPVMNGPQMLTPQKPNTNTFPSAMDAINGRRATGGSVSGNSRYLVGERGPEMFVPNRNGYILPNNKTSEIMGGGSVNFYGAVNIASQADADSLMARLSRNQELASKGLSSLAGAH